METRAEVLASRNDGIRERAVLAAIIDHAHVATHGLARRKEAHRVIGVERLAQALRLGDILRQEHLLTPDPRLDIADPHQVAAARDIVGTRPYQRHAELVLDELPRGSRVHRGAQDKGIVREQRRQVPRGAREHRALNPGQDTAKDDGSELGSFECERVSG